MRIQTKTIDGHNYDVLEALILDEADVADIQLHYTESRYVQMELSSLAYLRLFSRIQLLIITGGIPTPEGLMCLYGLKDLEILVLDFEETDSDAEGIDLARFPKLRYVLSRSNLNIYHYSDLRLPDTRIEVLNFYHGGRAERRSCASSGSLYEKKRFLFFSAEAQSPAGAMLMRMLCPIESAFAERYGNTVFSMALDSIGIIPICMPEAVLLRNPRKERKLVSLKRRYADIRLSIPFEEFVSGDEWKRAVLCRENIGRAARYISGKDKSFAIKEFLEKIDALFLEIYHV